MDFKNHDLELPAEIPGILYEEVPLRDPGNELVPGLRASHAVDRA